MKNKTCMSNIHQKLFKARRTWLSAAVAVLMLGLSGNTFKQSVHAATGTASTVITNGKASSTASTIQTAPSDITEDSFLKTKGIDVSQLNENDALKLASLFHIFANQATLSADTNGNLAVGTLNASTDFGTRGTSDNLTDGDIDYIQNITQPLNSNSFRNPTFNHVVLGKGVNVTINGDQVMIDGVTMPNLTPSDVYQDTADNVYIDFEQVFQELTTNATKFSNQSQSVGVSDNFSDMNNKYIDVSKAVATNGIVYVTIPFEHLTAPQPITIKGLSSDPNGPTIVMNVTGIPEGVATISTQTLLDYDDGTDDLVNGESHQEPNHLLWNLGNGTQTFSFNGGRFMGSLLAPKATINAGVNIDGNIVANEVNISGGESHRWDIHPSQPTTPTQPTQPSQPTTPTQPTQPSQPTTPTQPTQPSQPTTPTQPTQPTTPTQPTQPSQPTTPTQPMTPTQPTVPTSDQPSDGNKVTAVKKEEATLPQTGERASAKIWLGVILVTAGLISWIVSIHQKKRIN